MEAIHQASGYPGQVSSTPLISPAVRPGAGRERDLVPRLDWDALRSASRSCCCAARPVVVALMPPAPGRPHRTDLLLCMHHFRGTRQALAAANASVLGMNGKLVDPGMPAFLPPE